MPGLTLTRTGVDAINNRFAEINDTHTNDYSFQNQLHCFGVLVQSSLPRIPGLGHLHPPRPPAWKSRYDAGVSQPDSDGPGFPLPPSPAVRPASVGARRGDGRDWATGAAAEWRTVAHVCVCVCGWEVELERLWGLCC